MSRRRGRGGDRKAQRTIAIAQALSSIIGGLTQRWKRNDDEEKDARRRGLEDQRAHLEQSRLDLAEKRYSSGEDHARQREANDDRRYDLAQKAEQRRADAETSRHSETMQRLDLSEKRQAAADEERKASRDLSERRYKLSEESGQRQERNLERLLAKDAEGEVDKKSPLGIMRRINVSPELRTEALSRIGKHGGDVKAALAEAEQELAGHDPNDFMDQVPRERVLKTTNALRSVQQMMAEEASPDLNPPNPTQPPATTNPPPGGQQTGMGVQQGFGGQLGGPQQPMSYLNPGGVVDAVLSILFQQGTDPMAQAMSLGVGYQMVKDIAAVPHVPALDAVMSVAQRKLAPSVMANQSGQMPASALGREGERPPGPSIWDLKKDIEQGRRRDRP